MSTSIGNVVDPNVLIDTYGLTAVRYFHALDGGFRRRRSVKDLPTPLDMDRELLALIEGLPGFFEAMDSCCTPKGKLIAKNPEHLRMILCCAFRSLNSAGLLLQPFMPAAANAILTLLKVPLDERSFERVRRVVRYTKFYGF
ncbi:hypothetical protein BJ742DRAFT_869047 [Cladochytrium replicatum]|nr:hypothetical protein BJ742DRAFT_869047 [Cladochytrium replicatum]